MSARKTDPLVRFESYVQRTESCWLWTGRKLSANRYGQFWDGARLQMAHRWSYATFVAPIRDGQVICHKCDNPKCVRPDHLFVGTQLDNMRDMIAKGRKRVSGGRLVRDGFCVRGHSLTGSNLRIKRLGAIIRKICRECERAWRRRAREITS